MRESERERKREKRESHSQCPITFTANAKKKFAKKNFAKKQEIKKKENRAVLIICELVSIKMLSRVLKTLPNLI